jgi:hypothetical protein
MLQRAIPNSAEKAPESERQPGERDTLSQGVTDEQIDEVVRGQDVERTCHAGRNPPEEVAGRPDHEESRERQTDGRRELDGGFDGKAQEERHLRQVVAERSVEVEERAPVSVIEDLVETRPPVALANGVVEHELAVEVDPAGVAGEHSGQPPPFPYHDPDGEQSRGVRQDPRPRHAPRGSRRMVPLDGVLPRVDPEC